MNDILIDNKEFYNFEVKFLDFISIITKVSFVLFIIGFFQSKKDYIIQFNFIVKVILALFLVYRFNNYRKNKIEFTELDRKVCYSSGIYIILVSFFDLINNYIDTIRNNHILPITQPLIEWVKKILKNQDLLVSL
jgi:O-antigen/teichoic acid export membrane protein